MQRVAWELTLDGLLGMAVAKVRLMSDAVPQTYGTGRYDIDQPYVRASRSTAGSSIPCARAILTAPCTSRIGISSTAANCLRRHPPTSTT